MNKPFLMKPSSKDYLWGGTRLNDDFGKNIESYPLAETWECSTHPDGPSYAVSGIFKGKSLIDILKIHPEYIGTHPVTKNELPILIKFIDAKNDLSVQVHPDDEYARNNEGVQFGKTEMWYVLDAKKNASLVYGLKHNLDKSTLKKAIDNGTLERYMQRIKVKKDDMFFIKAGTIHAIGAGLLIAEIQENSNLTYRLYDYNRVDKNGNKRELHIDKALDVSSLKKIVEPKQPLRVLKYEQGIARELLSRCQYFEVYRIFINTERRQKVFFKSDSDSFRVLLCINGCGTIRFGDELLYVYKGDCIFVPADSIKMQLHGYMQFLDIRG